MWWHTRRRARATGESGFTLIEVLVGLALIGVVLASAGVFLVNSMKTVHVEADREIAARLAAGAIAQVAEAPVTASLLTAAPEPRLEPAAGVDYYVTTIPTRCWQASPAGGCLPTRTTGAVPLLRVEVTVSWAAGTCQPETCERSSVLLDGTDLDQASGTGLEPR